MKKLQTKGIVYTGIIGALFLGLVPMFFPPTELAMFFLGFTGCAFTLIMTISNVFLIRAIEENK